MDTTTIFIYVLYLIVICFLLSEKFLKFKKLLRIKKCKNCKKYINFPPHNISYLLNKHFKRNDINVIYHYNTNDEGLLYRHGYYIYLGKVDTGIKFSMDAYEDLCGAMGEDKAIVEICAHYIQMIERYLKG